MLLTELKKLKLQKVLISIERSCHDEEITGIIHSVSPEIIAMHLYLDNGEYDGLAVFETCQIDNIYWGNRAHKAIAHLIDRDEEIVTPKFKSKAFQDVVLELNSSFDSLQFHVRNDEDHYDIGKIKNHDERWFKINAFGTKKSLSRLEKILLRKDVSRVVVNSPYQNNIVELHSTGL